MKYYYIVYTTPSKMGNLVTQTNADEFDAIDVSKYISNEIGRTAIIIFYKEISEKIFLKHQAAEMIKDLVK